MTPTYAGRQPFDVATAMGYVHMYPTYITIEGAVHIERSTCIVVVAKPCHFLTSMG